MRISQNQAAAQAIQNAGAQQAERAAPAKAASIEKLTAAIKPDVFQRLTENIKSQALEPPMVLRYGINIPSGGPNIRPGVDVVMRYGMRPNSQDGLLQPDAPDMMAIYGMAMPGGAPLEGIPGLVEPKPEFMVLERVVSQGQNRITSMAREAMQDLQKVAPETLDNQQKTEFQTLNEAYNLVTDLVKNLAQMMADIQGKLGPIFGRE